MITLPNPLHPAIVHFPIVLIMLGSIVAVVAVIFPRRQLKWLAAGWLSVAAVAAIGATWSGGDQADRLGDISDRVEALVEQHEEWGDNTRNLALGAAILAVAGASLGRFPRVSRGLGVVTVLVALAAAYAVAETGHYGGQLVYEHGVGIKPAAGNKSGAPAGVVPRAGE